MTSSGSQFSLRHNWGLGPEFRGSTGFSGTAEHVGDLGRRQLDLVAWPIRLYPLSWLVFCKWCD